MIYKFMSNSIGEISYDYFSLILFRRLDQIRIRRHPNTIGISTAILLDLIRHGTKLIIVKVDGNPCFKVDPETWLQKGIVDKLSADQDPHAFLDLSFFEKLPAARDLDLRIRSMDPYQKDQALAEFTTGGELNA